MWYARGVDEPRLPSEATSRAPRAVLLSHHAGTARTVAQALGAAGITLERADAIGDLGARCAELTLLDLDLSPSRDAGELSAEAAARCPSATVVALAGRDARRRLTAALGAGAVRHAVPKPLADGDGDLYEGPDERDLCVAVRRVAGQLDALAGVRPYLAGGAELHERTVAGSAERDAAVIEVLELADRMRLGGELRRRIELTAEELLLNALYDAPHDGAQPRYGDRAAVVALAPAEQVTVRWGCDGRAFAVAVADRFGRLRRDTVAAHLQRGLAPGARPAAGPGGASLGLLLAFAASNQLVFSVVPGAATEVTAVIEVAGGNRRSLARGAALHFYEERAA